MRIQKLAIIVPCFNEGARLTTFLSRLDSEIPSLRAKVAAEVTVSHIDLVLIDDGSRTPLLAASFPRMQNFQIHLLRHPMNLGQGAAIQTGVQYARDFLGSDFFATMDSDGQHRPEDLAFFLKKMSKGEADILFGNRFLGGSESVPSSRRALLRAATLFEWVLTGVRLGDAHNGYRLFNRTYADQLALKQNRMAHATEFKQLVREGSFRFAEVPVVIQYTEETLAKGQKNLGFLSILKELLNVYLFQK